MACEPPAEMPAEDILSSSSRRVRQLLPLPFPIPTSASHNPPHAVVAPFVASAEDLVEGEAIHGELAEAEAIIDELRGRLQAVSSERDAAAARADAAAARADAATAGLTAAVAAAKALFETQAGLKLLAPPLPVYSDGDAGSAVGSKRRGPTDSFVASAKRSRTLALREKTRRAWLAWRAREKVSRLEMLRKATRRAHQRAHDDAAESSATENSAAEI